MSADQQEDFSAEQRQFLAHVEGVEKDIGGAPGEGDQGGEQQGDEGGNPAEENKAILQLLVHLLTPALPFLPDVYTPDVVQQIAYAYTAVEEKHGWNARSMLSVEFQLAIVAIPPTYAAVALGREYFAAKKREAEKVINPKEGGGDGSNQ